MFVYSLLEIVHNWNIIVSKFSGGLFEDEPEGCLLILVNIFFYA